VLPALRSKLTIVFLLSVVIVAAFFAIMVYYGSSGDNRISMVQEQAGVVEVEGELVPDLPKTPQYPEALVVRSRSKAEEEGEKSYQVSYKVEGTVPDVMSWYLNSLGKEGVRFEVFPSDVKDPEIQFASGRDSFDRLVHLSVVNDEDGFVNVVIDYVPASVYSEDDVNL